MVGKKSARSLLREEGISSSLNFRMFNRSPAPGLSKTDNNLDLTIWPQVNMINQKNYYTSVPLGQGWRF